MPPLDRGKFRRSGKEAVIEFIWFFPQWESVQEDIQKTWSLSFPEGVQVISVLTQALPDTQVGARSHSSSIMFLSGDLSKGVVSAWSGVRMALCRVLATKVYVGLKRSIYKRVVK